MRYLEVLMPLILFTGCASMSCLFSDTHLSRNLAACNVIWDSPSKDSLDSMPLSGRMGAGANVWVQDGSIRLYLAHNAAYDERGRLLKLGCFRVAPADNAQPVHNWGGSGMIGLQEMLMAADPGPSGKIFLLPAWPKERDVRFKLQAPKQTTVECVYRSGKIEQLKVTPELRRKDVEVCAQS